MFRIGHGYDTHAFEAGKKLVLGGIAIPYHAGMKGHSDGDVIIHAICDALLGAAALGDIGQHFPDTDQQYKNIDSRILLRYVVNLIQASYLINNIDVTVLAQAPKLAPHIDEMRLCLSREIQISQDDISIKATTTEKMGFIGRNEGIACYAITLLTKIKTQVIDNANFN